MLFLDHTTGAFKSDPDSGKFRVTIWDMIRLAVSEGIDHLGKPALDNPVRLEQRYRGQFRALPRAERDRLMFLACQSDRLTPSTHAGKLPIENYQAALHDYPMRRIQIFTSCPRCELVAPAQGAQKQGRGIENVYVRQNFMLTSL